MRKNNSIINNIVVKFLAPYFACFTAYIQIFGEIGPGGGFQAGALFASVYIAYNLSSRVTKRTEDFYYLLLIIASFGVLLYGFTGLSSIFFGKNFLNYDIFFSSHPQSVGIILVEFGVGITVSSVMIYLYEEIKNA